ncbi:glycosyl hydrolase family 61 domain-containing protein [Rhizoctonia solani AG-1 IA]|uniref:AA9 family lytic polysaccharide monooxygenase n=1 Tax=Thanatephorus cucumeris (strain AG1-IA) TaxID=983506 RepID=L8WWI2_THACA|nr:glycosyl hydrolase family 61 domain-containing protein [Rhizoctonia solani AG-1 IA]
MDQKTIKCDPPPPSSLTAPLWMKASPVYLAALFSLVISPGARAHGFVKTVEILGSDSFNGPKPGATGANKSPIRGITDQSPVKNLQSKDIICGIGATPGSVVASAKPGDTLVYSWANDLADNGNWIHDTGPMMTYFAQVPSGQTADKFNGEGAQWFKTDQVGKKNNKWIQGSLMTGATFKTKIPETLANGDYLVRHETILSTSLSLQIRIKNSNAGNATVTATPTLSFPGAYTADDPGLLVNVFAQAADGSEYKFPAGPIAEVTAPGATGSSPNVLISQSASLVTETSSSTSAPFTPSSVITTTSLSATATVVTSSAIITSASTTTSATAPVTTSNTELQGVRLANGRAAQALNIRFQNTTISDKCEPLEPGCVGGQFAICTQEGTWSLQDACFSGTSCFVIPLKNINGTQVGCFPESVVEQAIIDSGVGRGPETSTIPTATQYQIHASNYYDLCQLECCCVRFHWSCYGYHYPRAFRIKFFAYNHFWNKRRYSGCCYRSWRETRPTHASLGAPWHILNPVLVLSLSFIKSGLMFDATSVAPRITRPQNGSRSSAHGQNGTTGLESAAQSPAYDSTALIDIGIFGRDNWQEPGLYPYCNTTSKDSWSASQYNKNAAFVYSDAYTQPILELLSLKPGERILDMGCGTGELTCRVQEAVGQDGMIVGIDSSQNMLERAKANGVENIFCPDIQSLTMLDRFESLARTFDAERFCLLKENFHTEAQFNKPSLPMLRVRSALHQVLRRRGIDPSRVDPWYFPRSEHYASVLESEGFKIEQISLNPRFTPLPGPLIDWLRTFARNSILANMNDEDAEQVMQDVSDLCEPDMKDEKGGWAIMYVRLRFRAVLPL